MLHRYSTDAADLVIDVDLDGDHACPGNADICKACNEEDRAATIENLSGASLEDLLEALGLTLMKRGRTFGVFDGQVRLKTGTEDEVRGWVVERASRTL